MTILVAIDPGVSAGVACFVNGTLRHAECVIKARERKPVAANTVVVEVPEVYPGSPVRPADLIKLSWVAGYLTGLYDPPEVHTVKPSQWKGQVPKNINHKRILAKLSDSEKRVLEKTKANKKQMLDVMDSVGIGLWFLDR